MKTIRVLVVDDEPLARRGVCQLLRPHVDFAVAGECRNGQETLLALDRLAPDVLFLDVQMPEMDGFDVLSARGAARMPMVVFVTAYDQYAVRAFEAHALDYLVKPLQEQRFDAAIARVRERLQWMDAERQAAQLEALLQVERSRRREGGTRLRVVTPSGVRMIALDEIVWISADDYYSRIHAVDGSYLIREPMSSLDGRLDGRRFVRVHRSAIVALEHVKELRQSGNGEDVLLSDGTRVPVSRRRRAVLQEMLRTRST